MYFDASGQRKVESRNKHILDVIFAVGLCVEKPIL